MAIDPTAARASSTPSDNPAYLAGWVCYINGREVPIYGFETNSTVWEPPTMRIHLLPDVLLMRLGHEDRVPVVLFYLDHWVEEHRSDFRLLGDGEILGWQYSHAKGIRTVAFTVTAHIHVFQQLYFHYMTNIDDVVAARSPELVASSIATTPGPIYPYALFHQGLNQTAAQIEAATPRPGVTVTDTNPDAETPGATQPIQAPYELVYNAIRGCIDASIPNERRSLPMMTFFARHIKKTRFHNRWVRLPLLEDPSVLAGNQGVFPIFKAAANLEALNAMQRHVASQVGNSGPVWNLFQQTLGLVYMEIGMIPNPCSVLVQLNDTSGVGNPVDGRIIGHPAYDTPLQDQRSVDQQLGPQAPAQPIYAPVSPLRRSEEEPLYVPTQRLVEVDGTSRVASTNPPGTGVVFPRVGAGGTEFGINPLTPIRLAQNFVKPTMHFAETPACNVIFPSMVNSWTYDENYLAQPTRIYINDSVMTNLLRADGPNREFMLHALTVGFPEEADALLHHKVGASQNGAGATTPTESGKNLLLWPEEFFKGPVTARAPLPAWFQFLRQFANSQALGGGSGAPTIGPPPEALTRAVSLLGGPSGDVSGGLASSLATGRLRGGRFHAGSDITAEIGTPVYAVLAGVVAHRVGNLESAESDQAGNMLVVNHPSAGPNGETVTCIYMHFQRFGEGIVRGSRLTPGQVVGYVGLTNGSIPDRDAILRAFPIPPEMVTAAFNDGTQTGAENILAPYLRDQPLPAGVDRTTRPWNFTEREINPDPVARRTTLYTPVPQWKILARCVAGLFHQTGGAHCHLEVLFTPKGQRVNLRPPHYVNGVLTPNNRVDAVAWLNSLGVFLGTNHSNPANAMRRGRIGPGAPPVPTPNVSTTRLPASTPGALQPALPSAGTRPQVTTVTRDLPRVAPNPSATTPGSAGAGAPGSATAAPVAPVSTVPAGTAAEGDTFAALFRLYAQQEYLRQRYSQRAASVNMLFNPYIVAGFPSFIFDNVAVGMHAVGYVQSVSHSGVVQGNSASLSTSAQHSYCRMLYEFLSDVRADAVRFAGRVTSAPAEIISEIREIVQDEGRAELFYKTLLYGGRSNISGACFRWTEAMGYTDGGQILPIEIVGDTVAVQEARLRAIQAASRGEGNDVGAEQGQANPATVLQSAAVGGVSSQGQTTVRMTLDPDKELSPRNNIYGEAFRSYHVAMRLAARPACTIDEYVRFYHGGKTITQLQQSGQVGQLRTDFSYKKETVADFVSAGARADGTVRLTPGLIERPNGSFYDHIYRLIPGPGRNERNTGTQTSEDRRTPPSDEEQGFTSPPADVLPTSVSRGLPANYPQTRADWDTVLDLYREKVRTRVTPSR